MNKLMSFVEDKMAPVFSKLAANHHMAAVRDGMMVTIPLTIIGSIFLMIPNIPIDAVTTFFEPYAGIFTTVTSVTLDAVGLVAAFTIAYYFAKGYSDVEVDPLITAMISGVSFLLATLTDEFTIDTGLFGTKGLFTAMIVAFLTGSILHLFIKKDLVIHFPDNVPPMVSTSFMGLIPGLVTLVIIWIVRIILGININDVLTAIFSPLVFALNTLPGFMIFMFIRCLLWGVGIHGGAVLSIANPVFLTMFGENAAAFAAGTTPPFITANGFMEGFIFFGGGGATLPLVFLMMRSKDKGFKTLGKLCLPSSLFEINEPVVFGVPIVMNPLMIIPYILATEVLALGTYLLMYFNIIGRVVVNAPWTMPPVITAYLNTGGNIPATIWSIVELFIAGAIYYPFFKIMEKQRLQEENEEA